MKVLKLFAEVVLTAYLAPLIVLFTVAEIRVGRRAHRDAEARRLFEDELVNCPWDHERPGECELCGGALKVRRWQLPGLESSDESQDGGGA